jgi:hypothetical protein
LALAIRPAPAAAQESGAEASSADSTAQSTRPQDSVREEQADSVAEEPEVKLNIGGALRLNYAWQDYNEARIDRSGDFFFEVFMLSVDAEYDDIFLSVQYRWYFYFEAIRYAGTGSALGNKSGAFRHFALGLTQFLVRSHLLYGLRGRL